MPLLPRLNLAVGMVMRSSCGVTACSIPVVSSWPHSQVPTSPIPRPLPLTVLTTAMADGGLRHLCWRGRTTNRILGGQEECMISFINLYHHKCWNQWKKVPCILLSPIEELPCVYWPWSGQKCARCITRVMGSCRDHSTSETDQDIRSDTSTTSN